MMYFLAQFWGVLTLEPAVYAAIKNNKNGVWIALRFFILAAVLATIGQLSSVGDLLQKPDVSDFFDKMALRFEGWGRLHPLLLGDAMSDLSGSMQETSAFFTSLQPPLGKDTSLILRASGRWLQTPLNLLAAWLTASMAIFAAARLFDGKGSLREHVSLFLLAFLPQALAIFNSFAAINASFAMAGQVFLVAAWIWGFFILFLALKTIHNLGRPVTILLAVLAFTIFEFVSGSLSFGSALVRFILNLLF